MNLRSPLAVVLIIAFLVSVSAALWQTWRTTPTAGAPGQEGYVSTQWGPLSPADRDALIRVRLANLWEIPTSQQMQERGSQTRVREIAQTLEADHKELDVRVRDVSRQLGILLPNQATFEQQAWMEQISASTGADYDWMSVNLLRAAHGGILPKLAVVRAGTRNDLVRQFVDQGIEFVKKHIGLLESTGLVDFARLDEPPNPPRAVVTRAGQYENVPVALISMATLVIAAALGAVLMRLLKERRKPRPSAHRRRASPPETG